MLNRFVRGVHQEESGLSAVIGDDEQVMRLSEIAYTLLGASDLPLDTRPTGVKHHGWCVGVLLQRFIDRRCDDGASSRHLLQEIFPLSFGERLAAVLLDGHGADCCTGDRNGCDDATTFLQQE